MLATATASTTTDLAPDRADPVFASEPLTRSAAPKCRRPGRGS